MDMAVSHPSQHEGSHIEPGKLFVGGLSWETRKESFAAYFSQFGDLQEAIVIMEPDKGYLGAEKEKPKNRGFGFVKFVNPADAEKVLDVKEHVLDNKKVDAKRAVKGEKHKVFVGGIPAEAEKEDFRQLMEQYGEISDEDGSVDLKKAEGPRNRGFGFVTYKHKQSMEEAVKAKFIPMTCKTGIVKQVEVKVAINPAKSGLKSRQYQQGMSAPPYQYPVQAYQHYEYNYGSQASQYPSGSHSYPTGSGFNMYGTGSSQQQMSTGYDQSGYSGFSNTTHGHTDQSYYYQQQQQQQQPHYSQGAQNGGSWRGQPQQSSAYGYGGQQGHHPAVRQ